MKNGKEGLSRKDVLQFRTAVAATALGLPVLVGAITWLDPHLVKNAEAHLLKNTGISRPSEQAVADAYRVKKETSTQDREDNRNPSTIPSTIFDPKQKAAQQTIDADNLYTKTRLDAEDPAVMVGGGGAVVFLGGLAGTFGLGLRNEDKRKRYENSMQYSHNKAMV